MTAVNARPFHLCILPGTHSMSAMRDSVSCLRRRPDVMVTIVPGSEKRRALQLKKYVERRFGNTVYVAEAGVSSGPFTAAGPTDRDGGIVFLPAGDWLSDDALDALSCALEDRDADIVYVDEDSMGARGHLEAPRFKPDANYEYLAHYDYVGDLLCIRNSILADYGGIDPTNYAASRYALLLRVLADGRKIEHLSRPLYHARKKAGCLSTASILRSHFAGVCPGSEVLPGKNGTFRIKRPVRGRSRTTIVIPFRDRPRLLRQCLESVLGSTENNGFDVLGVSNCSRSSETYGLMDEFSSRDSRIRFVEHNIPFNFSALVNRGVELATGEFIVLMNNDITVAGRGWLDAMLEYGQLDGVGVVGAKLLYPNGAVQHAGLSVQQSEHVGHMHKNYPGESPGYMNRLICAQAVTAVTAALCMFRKDLHRLLNGFDEDRFGVAYNDVDFCLRAEALGRRNIFTPFALAYHHESLSRGYEDTDWKRSRFEKERRRFWERHRYLRGLPDPNYNPNLDQYRDDFSY